MTRTPPGTSTWPLLLRARLRGRCSRATTRWTAAATRPPQSCPATCRSSRGPAPSTCGSIRGSGLPPVRPTSTPTVAAASTSRTSPWTAQPALLGSRGTPTAPPRRSRSESTHSRSRPRSAHRCCCLASTTRATSRRRLRRGPAAACTPRSAPRWRAGRRRSTTSRSARRY